MLSAETVPVGGGRLSRLPWLHWQRSRLSLWKVCCFSL